MTADSPTPQVQDQRPPDSAGRGLPSRRLILWIGGVLGVLVLGITVIDSLLPHHKAAVQHQARQSRHRDLAQERPNARNLRHLLRKQERGYSSPNGLGGGSALAAASVYPTSPAARVSDQAQGGSGAGLPPSPDTTSPYANVDSPPPVPDAANRARAHWANIRASGIVVQKGGQSAPAALEGGSSAFPEEFPGAAPTPLAGAGNPGSPAALGGLPPLSSFGRHTMANMFQKPRPPSRTHSYRRYLATAHRHTKKRQSARIHRAIHGVAIAPGTPIPAILLTRINTQLPGSVVAQVTRTIYSPRGQVAIPAGTKVVGSYDSRVFDGQSRTLVAFREFIFPDGETLRLPGTEAGGVRGSAGVAAHVDDHLWSSLGSAFLVAELSNLANLGGGGSSSTYNYGGGGGSSSLGAGGQVIVNEAQNILNPYMNIPPTLIVEPGKALTIMVMRTVVFRR